MNQRSYFYKITPKGEGTALERVYTDGETFSLVMSTSAKANGIIRQSGKDYAQRDHVALKDETGLRTPTGGRHSSIGWSAGVLLPQLR